MSPPPGAPAAGGVSRRLWRRMVAFAAAVAERWARHHFEVRVWNAIDPKDPQPVTLFLGDPTPLKDGLLALSGSIYADLDADSGLELYSQAGLRVTDWSPAMLFLAGVRNATLHGGAQRRETLRLAGRLAVVGLLVFGVSRYLYQPPSATATQPLAAAPVAADNFASTLTTLRSRCAGEVACDVAELERSGQVNAPFLRALGARDGLVIAGFAPGRATVPNEYLPVLANLFRLDGSGRCSDILLLGRASTTGERELNVVIAAQRAAAVRRQLATGAPGGSRGFVTLVSWQHPALALDHRRLREDLERAALPSPRDPQEFARFADRSVQVICLP